MFDNQIFTLLYSRQILRLLLPKALHCYFSIVSQISQHKPLVSCLIQQNPLHFTTSRNDKSNSLVPQSKINDLKCVDSSSFAILDMFSGLKIVQSTNFQQLCQLLIQGRPLQLEVSTLEPLHLHSNDFMAFLMLFTSVHQ